MASGGGVLARARIVLEGDTVALTRSLQGAEKAMTQAGRRMSAIGRSMSSKVTLPILAVGIGAIKAFADFDNAMVQSIAIMGDVSDVMKNEMAEAAKEVARTTTTGSKKAADAFFFLASAGLTAEQSIAALPQVAKFAQAGMFGMALATDLATDAQSALGLTVDDAGQNLVNLTRVTDVLVKANTLANASVQQFSEALTREAGAALKTFNISIEEGVAVLAAFADQGVKSQVAGTGLARILRLMSAAATKHKVELEELGIAIFDDTGKIRNLADIIADMEVAFGRMSDETRTAALESIGFTARVQGIILPLLGTSEAIREYQKALEGAAGITQEISDKQLKSFTSQLKLMWNQIVLAADAAAGTMEPAMRKMAIAIRDGARDFEDMSEGARKTIVVILGLVAGVGPLLLLFGGLFVVIGKVTLSLQAMTVAAFGAGRALVALQILFSPIGAILVGLTIGLALLAKAWLKAGAEARQSGRDMEEAAKNADEILSKVSLKNAQITKVLLDRLQAEAEAKIEVINQAIQKLLDDPTGFRRTINAEIILKDEAIDEIQVGLTAINRQLDVLETVIVAEEAALAVQAKLAKEAEKAVDPYVALAEAMDNLKTSMMILNRLNELFGEGFDLTSERAAALETGIQDLIVAGADFDLAVGPNGETLRELAADYLALVEGMDRAADAQTRLADAMSDAAQITRAVRNKTEILNETMNELGLHLLFGRINQETFTRAVAQAKGVLEETAVAGDEFGKTMEQAGQQALNSFVSFTTRAGSSFRQFIDDAIRDLQRLTIKLALTELFEGVLSSKTGGGDTDGQQHGGFVQPGGVSLVGEAGPELIRAGRGGVTVQPLRGMEFAGAGAGGAGAQVSLTINAVDAKSFADLVEANPGAITAPLVRALRRSSVLGNALSR